MSFSVQSRVCPPAVPPSHGSNDTFGFEASILALFLHLQRAVALTHCQPEVGKVPLHTVAQSVRRRCIPSHKEKRAPVGSGKALTSSVDRCHGGGWVGGS